MRSTRKSHKMNLASRLEKSLSPKQLALIRLIADEASRRGLMLHAVGGLPRDLLLDRLTRDLDLVIEGDAIPLARALSRLHGGRVTTHPAFHTATWFLPPHLTPDTSAPDTIDLISARSETYDHPAALPTVTLGALTDDLRRRDFTVSAMAIRLDGDHFGELVDPLGGQADLKRKLIRVLHPRSFIDDPTRIFRAVRYAVRLGFEIASETRDHIPAALRHVDKLSPERLRHELDLILEVERPARMLASLAEVGLLSAVTPSMPGFNLDRAKWLGHIPPVEFGLDADLLALGYCLWFMDMPEDSVITISKRLGFTTALTKTVCSAARLAHDLAAIKNLKPSEWTERLDKHSPLAIYAVYLVHRKRQLADYLKTWRYIKPTVTGDDLKKLGLSPGPAYKRILSTLRAAWLDGDVTNASEEEKMLKSLLN